MTGRLAGRSTLASMRRTATVAAVLVLVAGCGGSSGSETTTTQPPVTTTAPATTTTAAPTTTTTTVPLDCAGFGAAMTSIAQSFLYQTFDGGAAFERKQGAALADALEVVSEIIGDLGDQVAALGAPPDGYEGAVTMMLQAIDMDFVGYADAAAAARAGDEAALDLAVTNIDEAFGILMNANVALSEAQACAG